MAVADIGNKDLFWSVIASLFKLGSGVLLFPFILNKLSSDTIGIWVIFTTISVLPALMDFGFKTSFARSISYVYSGAKSLKRRGFDKVNDASDDAIDYSLLKSTLRAMKYFYSRIALVLFVMQVTLGTYYIYTLVQKYDGSSTEIYVSWAIHVVVSTYNLYTLYFDALLTGRGDIKQYNKFVLCGNVVYIVLAALLVMSGFGLIAIVSAQAVSTFIVRFLSYRCFYDKGTRDKLYSSNDNDYKDIIKTISPNAIKVGLTTLGGFLINKSALFVGSFYLMLEEIAVYGITLQLVAVIGTLAFVHNNVYMPKVCQWRLKNNISLIKQMYYRSAGVLVVVFLVVGTIIYFCGNWGLDLLGSQTHILSGVVLVVIIVVQYLETNQYLATAYLLSKNEVPFFRASLITAAATLALLIVFVHYYDMGLWGMVLAPGLCQLVYQNWKWPFEVMKEFNSKT